MHDLKKMKCYGKPTIPNKMKNYGIPVIPPTKKRPTARTRHIHGFEDAEDTLDEEEMSGGESGMD